MRTLTSEEYELLRMQRDGVRLGGQLASDSKYQAALRLVADGRATLVSVTPVECSCGAPGTHRHVLLTSRGLLAMRLREITTRKVSL